MTTNVRMTAKRRARGLTRAQVGALQGFAHGLMALRADRLETWHQDGRITVAVGRNGWGDLDFAVWVESDGRIWAEMTVDNMSADTVTVRRQVPEAHADTVCAMAEGGPGPAGTVARVGLVVFIASDDRALADRALEKVDGIDGMGGRL